MPNQRVEFGAGLCVPYFDGKSKIIEGKVVGGIRPQQIPFIPEWAEANRLPSGLHARLYTIIDTVVGFRVRSS